MKLKKNTVLLLKAVAERAIKTFAQAFIGAYPISAQLGGDVLLNAAEAGVTAAILSVATSFASMRFGKNGPSLATESVAPDEVAGH
jgi:hypothetical protein